jgi:thiamine kinase-like enzyme
VWTPNVYNTSDYRVKDNVKQLDDTFSVKYLKPISYTNNQTQKQDIGLIAHELQEQIPELVTGEKDGPEYQTINYIGLIGVLIKEVQQLQKINTNYEEKINHLETILKNHEERLFQLEN